MTTWVQDRANELLREDNADVKRVPFATAHRGGHDAARKTSIAPYVEDLRNVIDMDAIRAAGLQAGGGPAGRRRACPTGSRSTRSYGLDITVVNPKLDPTFSFMTVDHDGKIRMDCSSPYAMAGLVGLKDQYRRGVRQRPGCRPARHRDAVGGLDEPESLPGGGDQLPADPSAALARTGGGGQDAGQQQHDRPGGGEAGPHAGRGAGGLQVFRAGLFDGSFCFGGEESAGASFLRQDGTVWTTDKDGI